MTRFGTESGEGGYADGAYDVAKFNGPIGLCLSLDGEVLMCADQDNNRIRRIDLSNSLVSTYVGSGQTDFKTGARLESSLHHRIRYVLIRSNQTAISLETGDRFGIAMVNPFR